MNKPKPRTWIFWLSVVAIILQLTPGTFSTYIYPDEIGVRRSVFGGIQDLDFTQGRRVSLPLLHRWYRLPRTLHYLEFSGINDLDLRTREQNVMHVDIAVIYKIMDGQAHLICREGMANSYMERIKSASTGFLREHLAQLSNTDIQNPDKRMRVAKEAIAPLNKRLRQYHVKVVPEGVVIRAITFDPPYEQRLQAKQYFAVQAELDVAEQKKSIGKQQTDTVSKSIDKDVAIEREAWNQRVELARRATETMIATVNADALKYDRKVRAEADAYYQRLVAEGERAMAEADATGQKLRAQALSTKAGRTYSAIIAVRRFQLGDIKLNSMDPLFLQKFGSMKAWRQFFLGE
ncbi:MAG: hypothetical protein KC502_01870 [Myxococcales bacterium]|nr:hypothetical protein [Myxococcales bacterium]